MSRRIGFSLLWLMIASWLGLQIFARLTLLIFLPLIQFNLRRTCLPGGGSFSCMDEYHSGDDCANGYVGLPSVSGLKGS